MATWLMLGPMDLAMRSLPRLPLARRDVFQAQSGFWETQTPYLEETSVGYCTTKKGPRFFFCLARLTLPFQEVFTPEDCLGWFGCFMFCVADSVRKGVLCILDWV